MAATDKRDRLNWLDPDAVVAWLDGAKTTAEDLISVAEDQTDGPGSRIHGRAGARRLVDEAARSLRSQLAYAKRGLPDASDEESGT